MSKFLFHENKNIWVIQKIVEQYKSIHDKVKYEVHVKSHTAVLWSPLFTFNLIFQSHDTCESLWSEARAFHTNDTTNVYIEYV